MDSHMEQFEHLKIQWEEITSATNSFDDNNCIGHGGFGKVYKGVLARHKEGSLVAFKRLDRKHGQGDSEFFKEINFLSRYTHENLISLLGYCIQKEERILVYEYASRGSLDYHLTSADLTWKQRLNICLDAAKGLNYLHDPRETKQRLIHCDIKSANILIDDQWNAKVADFGLSKIGPANQPNTLLLTGALGTMGYIDPVFVETYTLTKKSDVYSFGVVLFEVLCGSVCSESSNGRLHVRVPMWKKSYEDNNLDKIIVPYNTQNMDPTSFEIFSEIAFQCVKRSREERPLMSLVVEKLETALKFQDQLELQLLHHEVKKYEEILNLAVPPLTYESIEELKGLLSEGLLVNDGKTWFYLNEKGQHCEMVSIQECIIPGVGRKYRYVPEYNSRFPAGSYVSFDHNYKLRVRAQFLSPVITYTVNFIFKFRKDDKIQQQRFDINLNYKLDGETKLLISNIADKRDDEWWMVELCQFTSEGPTADLEIIIQGHGLNIVVDGIEFLPMELEKAEDQVLENQNVDDKDKIKVSRDSVQLMKMKEKVYLQATKVYDPACILREPLKWRTLGFKIMSEIRSELLSFQTPYAVYLVYFLLKDQSKFEAPLEVRTNSGSSELGEGEFWYVYLVSPQTPFIHRGKFDGNTRNPLNRPKIIGIPQQRSDGWTEVEVCVCERATVDDTLPMRLELTMSNYTSVDGFKIRGIELRPM